MAGLNKPRPHDLLQLADPRNAVPSYAPPWVATALSVAPWVVVRRAAAPAGRVAVGVRGTARSHRFAMEISDTAFLEVLAPEDLCSRAAELRPSLPAARALRAASTLLNGTGLPWGPTGSVGFQLASGVRTVTSGSDLDLLLRPSQLAARARLIRLHVALQQLPVRVDCQVEIDDGAVALGELASEARRMLLRSPTGPRLMPAPWSDAG
jgi:phosphoribosyl-dephospho-CoA transferase